MRVACKLDTWYIYAPVACPISSEMTFVMFHVWTCLNPLSPEIWLLILHSSSYTSPCKLVTRIWCLIKITVSTWHVWVFSLPVCWIMYGYYKEKLHVDHFFPFPPSFLWVMFPFFFFYILCTESKLLSYRFIWLFLWVLLKRDLCI